MINVVQLRLTDQSNSFLAYLNGTSQLISRNPPAVSQSSTSSGVSSSRHVEIVSSVLPFNGSLLPVDYSGKQTQGMTQFILLTVIPLTSTQNEHTRHESAIQSFLMPVPVESFDWQGYANQVDAWFTEYHRLEEEQEDENRGE
ncbi:hypothetical protein JAAARDRAFT_199791 [Jaapia argillacea MUCL 33604]|uniref:Uncharacterized protein n=1 Tax=Jaapia argillacea MUCL 33604 TaxID=933084 RepID=A0A067PA07_9AGAM|nr:hypothetical protein JAAARDRAFT_199791 [Jaapia argillacea MUCL 33604]